MKKLILLMFVLGTVSCIEVDENGKTGKLRSDWCDTQELARADFEYRIKEICLNNGYKTGEPLLFQMFKSGWPSYRMVGYGQCEK